MLSGCVPSVTIVGDKAIKPTAAGAAGRERAPRRASRHALGIVLLSLYAFLFLRSPLAEGLIDASGQAISRGAFVLSAILVPEQMVSAWFDEGRLPAGFGDRAPIIGLTLLWLAIAVCVGWPICRPLYASLDAMTEPHARGLHPRWRRTVRYCQVTALAALVGLALLSSVTLAIGLMGALHGRWPLLLGVTILVGLVWAWYLRGGARSELSSIPSAGSAARSDRLASSSLATDIDPSWGLFDQGLCVATRVFSVLAGLAILLGAWVPASEFDVLEYHLQAPKEFYQAGAIRFLPHNIYANMPLATEMHSLAMMVLVGAEDTWLGGLAGKSLSASITLVGALYLGCFIAWRYGSWAGWTAAGLWLAMPGMAQVATQGLIDGSLAVYVLTTVLVLLEVFSQPVTPRLPETAIDASYDRWARSSEARTGMLVIGLLAGAAAATKYPGLLFAVVPAAAWAGGVVLQSRLGRRLDGLRLLLCFLLGLLVTCGTWYLKNLWQTGNPFYPLAANFLGGRSLTPDKIAQWQTAHRVPSVVTSDADFIAGSLAYCQSWLGAVQRLCLTSPFVQPALICGLAIAVVLVCRTARLGFRKLDVDDLYRQTELRLWLGWSLWIAAVWWFATHRIDRFWLPLTGLWVAAAAVGLVWLRQQGQLWLAHAIVLLGLAYGVIVNCTIIGDNRYFVSLAALRDEMGDEHHVPRVSPAIVWINQHLDNHSRVLLLGEARVFEFRVPVIYSTCFDRNPGEVWLRDRSASEQLAALQEQGITHILVNWSEIARYRSPGNYGFSDWPQAADVQQWLDAGICRAVDWGLPATQSQLFEILPDRALSTSR
jgi:hypothetical protein